MNFFLFVIIFIPCTILLMLLIKFLIRLDLPRGYLEQKKKSSENLFSQFSSQTLSDKEKFIEAFTVDAKLYECVPDHLKRQVIDDTVATIQGLSGEDKEFVAGLLYADILECKNNGKQIRDFLYQKLNLKYKYVAKEMVCQLFNKVHMELRKLDRLQEEE